MHNKYTIEHMLDEIAAADPYVEITRAGPDGWRIVANHGTYRGKSLREALEEAYYGLFKS